MSDPATSDVTTETEEAEPATAKRGRLYWFAFHLRQRIAGFIGRHKRLAALLVLALVALLVHFRALLHPLVLHLRMNVFVIVFAVLLFVPIWLFARRRTKLTRTLAVVAAVAVAVALFFWGPAVHQYVALYYRYQTLDVVELDELPVSDHERIPPLNSIYTIAKHKIADTESPMRPDFVRVGDSYRFTLAIEPAYQIRRRFEGVRELFSISGTSPAPDFSNENRVSVEFESGEGLLGNRSTTTAVVRSFGLWRFLNYQPDGVIYTTDMFGRWVQIVPLVRWRGIFFPRPEFGGVQIVRQRGKPGLDDSIRRMVVGVGRWIPPEKIRSRPFLVGQNVLSSKVSRYVANSFRFQYGFLAPMPGYHRGDIRIPDLPEDMNDQPFTAYFTIDHERGGGKLYHYFALEPFDPEKKGMNTSVFVPADGSRAVFVYKHHERTGSPTGVSAIAHIVRESRKNYDWSSNRPVEHRPFIKDVGGERRFFWLTTVVTLAEGETFTAGSVPDLVLTDPVREVPVWVDSKKPESWLGQLESELASVWRD